MNEEVYKNTVAALRAAPGTLAEALVNEIDTLRHFRKFCPSVTGVLTDANYSTVTVGDTALTINEGSRLAYKDDWELGEEITVWHDGDGLAFDCDDGN